jgi:hypothetical protein
MLVAELAFSFLAWNVPAKCVHKCTTHNKSRQDKHLEKIFFLSLSTFKICQNWNETEAFTANFNEIYIISETFSKWEEITAIFQLEQITFHATYYLYIVERPSRVTLGFHFILRILRWSLKNSGHSVPVINVVEISFNIKYQISGKLQLSRNENETQEHELDFLSSFLLLFFLITPLDDS